MTRSLLRLITCGGSRLHELAQETPHRPFPFHPDPDVMAQLRSRHGFQYCQGQSLNGASFTAVEQLQEHIDAFIAAYNETAEPFVWTKKKVHQRRFKNRRITQL